MWGLVSYLVVPGGVTQPLCWLCLWVPKEEENNLKTKQENTVVVIHMQSAVPFHLCCVTALRG